MSTVKATNFQNASSATANIMALVAANELTIAEAE